MIVGIHPTGSKLDTVGRCPAAAALPQVETFPDDDDDPRAKGTDVHRFLELCAEVGRDAALEQVGEQWRPLCAEIDLAKLSRELNCSTEVALAYNWREDTTRRLYPIAHRRAYEIDESCEVAMRLDLLGASDLAVLIGDYKGPHAWLPAPAESYQLGTGAVAAARLLGRSSAVLEYIRIRDDSTVYKIRAELDVFGLEAAAERVRGTMEAVQRVRAVIAAGQVPNVSEGPWCRYCNARQSCPAKTAIIRQLVLDTQPLPPMTLLTPEAAARAYAMFEPMKRALKQVEGALYAYAKLDPIFVRTEDDGSERWFGELSRPGNEEVSGPVAHRVLTELYSGEVANAAVEYTATKTAIGAAVRAALPEGDKLAPALRAVYAAIDKRGGLHKPTTTTTTEYTISPTGEAKARKRKAG